MITNWQSDFGNGLAVVVPVDQYFLISEFVQMQKKEDRSAQFTTQRNLIDVIDRLSLLDI